MSLRTDVSRSDGSCRWWAGRQPLLGEAAAPGRATGCTPDPFPIARRNRPERERNGSGINQQAGGRWIPGNEKTPCHQGVFSERATRFELATLTLANRS